jgi:Right handed beta helix region
VSKRVFGRALAGTCAVLAALVIPAVADATTLWVSPAAPSAPFNSCAHPGYDSIQAAIGGPGTSIHVCAGAYAEQLQITRNVTITGYEDATLRLPAETQDTTTPCDAANEALNHLPDQDAISICGGKVAIKDLDVNAIWPGEPVGEGISCAYNLAGIFVAGGGNLTLSGSTVTGASPQKINGCQYGVGVLVGVPESGPTGEGKATLTSDTISGYEKNGIAAVGDGVEVKISKVTVTGAGIQKELAQNGIGIQEGAKGTIFDTNVTGNECEDIPACGPDALTQAQSDGIYFLDAAPESKVSNSVSDDNDVGIEAYDGASAVPVISHDRAEGNRDSAVQISAGQAIIDSDTLADSRVGIQLLQFEGQVAAPGGSASEDSIHGMSEWAVLGRSDQAAGDQPGEFTIIDSKISGNPGATPLKSVETENSAKLKIFAEKDR